MKQFKRVYHPWDKWEEIEYNMWATVENHKKYINRAAELLRDHKKLERFMMKVVSKWNYSSENALTDYTQNRRAWLGQAACALCHGCPENLTRAAWKKLSDEEKHLANRSADRAIRYWEENYSKSKSVYKDMGETLL